MKTFKYLLIISLITAPMFSCYEKYVFDYDHSSVGFAMEKPLRTVIADRDMEIYVGVSIGGKREVDTRDWATFEVDPTLLNGMSGVELLPSDYYTLADENTFRIRKSNLPVADVAVKFTEEFYEDPKSRSAYYVLPLRITGSSLDSVYRESSLIAVKYISAYHGTYYIRGTQTVTTAANETTTSSYGKSDLSQCDTRNLSTVSRNVLKRPGLGSLTVATGEEILLTFKPETLSDGVMQVEAGTVSGSITITDGSGTYSTAGNNPTLHLKYTFEKDGNTYKVEEDLILRQDPLLDLRVETW